MFVLGIDPGLTRCGYCVVEATRQGTRAVALGVLTTPPTDSVPRRLHQLQVDVRDLLSSYGPTEVAIERVLFQVNVRSAMSVAQASGIVMAESTAVGAEVTEYSPNQVKESVTGWGAAPKAQVQQMVATLLGLDAVPQPADAADAAAIALCHVAMAPLAGRGRDAVATSSAGRVRNRVPLSRPSGGSR